jgi:hypothetical protein
MRIDTRIVHRSIDRPTSWRRARSSVSDLAFVRHLRICRLVLILAGTVVCAWPTELTAAEARRISITVRVYQTAGLSATFEQRAFSEAETVLRAALVDVRWQKCAGPNRSPACYEPGGFSELLLVVRQGAPCREPSATLGHALVVPGAGGVMATVHLDCIAWLASVSKADVAVLLGRVVAHELGHLMMHTSSHARRGLMRANWTPHEVRRNLATDWAFTADDIAAMSRPAQD